MGFCEKSDELSGFTEKDNLVFTYRLLNFRIRKIKGTIFRRDRGPQYTCVLPSAPRGATRASLQVTVRSRYLISEFSSVNHTPIFHRADPKVLTSIRFTGCMAG
jgi:hypothetical protein